MGTKYFGQQDFRDVNSVALTQYAQFLNGAAVAVSPAGKARIRYNDTLGVFEQSVNGAAYTAFNAGDSRPVAFLAMSLLKATKDSLPESQLAASLLSATVDP